MNKHSLFVIGIVVASVLLLSGALVFGQGFDATQITEKNNTLVDNETKKTTDSAATTLTTSKKFQSNASFGMDAAGMVFTSNLPRPNGYIFNSDVQWENLELKVNGLASNKITNVKLRVDGKSLTDERVNNPKAEKFMLRGNDVYFTNMSALPSVDGDGQHTVTFDVTMENGTHFTYGQSFWIDRTAPVFSNVQLENQTVHFTLRDEGAGVSLTKPGKIQPVIVHTNDDYTLEEAGYGIHCAPLVDVRELGCIISLHSTLEEGDDLIIRVVDESGNVGTYSVRNPGHEKSVLRSVMDGQIRKIRKQAQEMGFDVSPTPSGGNQELLASDVVFDIHIFHLEPTPPGAWEQGLFWTLGYKVVNSELAVDNAILVLRSSLAAVYQNYAPRITRGMTTVYVHPQMDTTSVNPLVDSVVYVNESIYPSPFSSEDCDNVYDVCVTKKRLCDYWDCSNNSQRWVAYRKDETSSNDNYFTQAPVKTETHVPFIVVDSIYPQSLVGGITSVRRGIVVMDYADFVSANFSHSAYTIAFAHESGHIEGLGHSDSQGNLMADAAIGTNLKPEQLARVEAAIMTPDFKPTMTGIWFGVPNFLESHPNNGKCMTIMDVSPRLLDDRGWHKEECEAPYSGDPYSPTNVIEKAMTKRFCPLKDNGHGIAIVPIAISEQNRGQIQSMYPQAVIKECKELDCTCIPIPPKQAGGFGGIGPAIPGGYGDTPPGGGGGGRAGTATGGGSGGCGKTAPTPSTGDNPTWSCSATCPNLPSGEEQACEAQAGPGGSAPDGVSVTTDWDPSADGGQGAYTDHWCACVEVVDGEVRLCDAPTPLSLAQ